MGNVYICIKVLSTESYIYRSFSPVPYTSMAQCWLTKSKETVRKIKITFDLGRPHGRHRTQPSTRQLRESDAHIK